MVLYSFIKDDKGWYVDLKHTPFNRRQLGMVRGADTLLDIMGKGKKEVKLDAGTKPAKGYERLDRIRILEFGFAGADYVIKSFEGEKINHAVWLCPVTLWVFQRYPKNIYFKVK